VQSMVNDVKCPICGEDCDPNASELAVIPRAYAHKECFVGAGAGIFSIVRNLGCCGSRPFLASIGGSLVLRRDGIPSDEVWVAGPGDSLQRYRISAGDVTKLPPPGTPGEG
jgi:hypothetical protein